MSSRVLTNCGIGEPVTDPVSSPNSIRLSFAGICFRKGKPPLRGGESISKDCTTNANLVFVKDGSSELGKKAVGKSVLPTTHVSLMRFISGSTKVGILRYAPYQQRGRHRDFRGLPGGKWRNIRKQKVNEIHSRELMKTQI